MTSNKHFTNFTTMNFLNLTGSQWRNVVGSWVRSRGSEVFDDSDRERLQKLFEKYMPETLRYFAGNMPSIIPFNDVSLSVSVIQLLETVLTRNIVINDFALESVFVFCLIWGVGSILTISENGTDNRKIFSDWFRSKFKSVKLPSRDTVFDYWLDVRTNKFESWKSSPVFRAVDFHSEVMNMSEITVPTNETASISYWLNALVKHGTNVMLAGTYVHTCEIVHDQISLFSYSRIS